MLTDNGQGTVCGLGRWQSAKFHRRLQRWQSNGVSRLLGRREHLGERPEVRTRYSYTSLKGEMKRVCLERAHTPQKARGRCFIQSRWSFCDSLTRVGFREQLVPSTLTEDWVWNVIWKFQGMSRVCVRNVESKFRTIIWLEGGCDTESENDLLEKMRDSMSTFVSDGEWLHLPWECVHQEELCTFDSEHEGKVKLVDSSRKETSSLMGRKRGTIVPGVGVWHLKDFARDSNRF